MNSKWESIYHGSRINTNKEKILKAKVIYVQCDPLRNDHDYQGHACFFPTFSSRGFENKQNALQ